MGPGRRTQNTSLCENHEGTLVFAAGTFQWPLALLAPEHLNSQIQRATRNLMTRMRSNAAASGALDWLGGSHTGGLTGATGS